MSIDITIGKPIANTQIYILDKYGNPTPIGVTGELCIAGDGVGAGYLNRPELTAEKFVDNPFGEGKMYKTGDLAYWREDGNIVYVGRNDFQVKIRGLRIELGEIENAICQDENVSQAVIVVRKDENGRQLICAFYTEKAPTELKSIKKHISDKLPKYMMPHIFTVLPEMPLTSSGKINRKALPEVDLTNIESNAEYVAPKTDREIALTQVIGEILHIEKVGVLDNFFDLGGDSLKAIELIAKLEQNGYKTTVKTVFDYETITDLAEQLEATFDELEDIEIPDACPATQAQMRVYTAQSLGGESVVYNVPYIFETKGVDIPKLENAFKVLIARHDALRTRFETVDGVVMQTVEKNVPFSVEVSDNADTNDFVKPFDLSKAPLMRVRVVGNTIMLDMHHIICDGSTMPVLLGELNELYMGRELAPTRSYMEYAVRQQNFTDSEEYKAQEDYWLNVYKEETEELTINTDKPRGQKQTFNGNCIYSTIDKDLAKKIEQKANEYKVTPFVYYMAALNISLSKFSGQEDIVIGMPASGRKSRYLNTVGMFVNTVAMRNRPDGTKSLPDFISEVKENSVAALANQDYPYGDLVKKLQIPTSNRNPLFDIMFAYQSKEMTDIVFGDQKAELKPIYLNTAKYDMTFNVMPQDDKTVLMLEYCTDLYRESTVRRILNGYKRVLVQMLGDSEFYENYADDDEVIPTDTAEFEDEITIGKPIANTQVYILDKFGNPLPIGVTGELCIAGDCVGAGYLNRPELTAEKFVDNPFGEGKMYKTGDLAYWREDGNIVYVGRNDFQVKIRGLRIELGEIENAICQDVNVSQAVVVVRKDENGRQLICAFYTEKAPTELKNIKKHISNKLPKYMMPHIFTVLPEMPLTSSGKINRKALPEVDLSHIENTTEYVKPLGEMEKKLAGLFEQVLNYTPVGLYDDFFDLGGDSLKAIELVSKAHNEGVYFDLQNVFDYPTVFALCEFIKNGDKQETIYKAEDFAVYDSILKKNTLDNFVAPQKRVIGNVLITGVTGFLGIHILDEYLKTENGDAYCLVRGESIDAATKRLNDLLHYYFGNTYDNCDRIKIVCGDITEPFNCDADIDMVIHSAASVKHYGSYKYFYNINVEGTKNAIAFAKEKGAKLIHISTLSVSGNSFGDDFDSYISEEEKHFYESSLFIDQDLFNVYARSKFEAEKAVLDAMLDGLEANICRMGNLTNREQDAKFQPNYESNAFLGRVKAALEFGMIPDYLLTQYAEFSPIDYTAQAVMTIASHFNNDYTIFHINSHKPIYFDKMVEVIKKIGIDLNVVEGKVFAAALREVAKQSDTAYIFDAFVNDMDDQERLVYDSNIRIENDFTVKYLNSLGFDWCEIDYDYMKAWVEYFRGIGYLNV